MDQRLPAGYTRSSSRDATLTAPARHLEPLEAAPIEQQLGTVRIARRVLRTVVAQAALSVPGVAGLAEGSADWWQRLMRVWPEAGVHLAVHGNQVKIAAYLIAEPGVNMVDVGTAVQEAVGAAVEHILGMEVGEINVYIQDVA